MKKSAIFTIICISFILGIFAGIFFSNLMNTDNGLTAKVISAGDYFTEEDILVYPDRVVIKVANASIGRYEDSGSMIPYIDEYANGIRIKPRSEEEINVGDIITFRRGDEMIIHRVIEKSTDEEGTYFITRGDDNAFTDGKLRFDEIVYKTVGVIY